MSSEMTYGIWSLRVDKSKPTLKALIDSPLYDAKGNITTPVVDNGNRNVNLQIKFEDQEKGASHWSEATGWLVRPDLVVTAGHATFDHDYGRGKAVEVVAYVGHDGKKSITDPSVHVRKGVQVITPKGWIDGDTRRQRDVAFIKLDQPFTDITPFLYAATPDGDHPPVGDIGYPGDRDSDQTAAQMYDSWNGETYGLRIDSGGQHSVSSAPQISLGGIMKAMDGSGTAVETVEGIDYIHIRDPDSA
ncbi:hypothetical protein NW768_007386 [Fusarium equiseti]|uniref:Peptidase S1 domain-containing protein n=1 Tax=Fusarium equiseti TaxID=61235 RepID=A0ABQ8R7I9_FUSEQ|nr:hypothetical protein NW768_007386 [Fusarium equiseti]